MEIDLNIRMTLDDDKISNIPNVDEYGEPTGGHWSQDEVREHFRFALAEVLNEYIMESDEFEEDLETDLGFDCKENIFKEFGLKFEVDPDEEE